MGWYAVGGAGIFGGVGASVAFDITYSDNPFIEDVSGFAATVGGSITVWVLNVGTETNTPTPLCDKLGSYTISIGVGTPGAEGHGFATYTYVGTF